MAAPGAYTLAQLAARAAALAELEGFDNAATPPDWSAQVNAAYAEFCWLAETHTETVTLDDTVAGQAEYTLGDSGTDRAIKIIHEVWVDDDLLEPGSESSLRQRDERWSRKADGTPCVWWRPSPWVIRLWPAPATGGQALTVRCVRPPAPLTATQYPDIHEVFHARLADRAYMEEAIRWVRGDARQALTDNIDRWRSSITDAKGRAATEGARGVQVRRLLRASGRVSP